MYPNDPQKIVYHSVHPTPCYRPERAGTPIGNGIYDPRRYSMDQGVEANLSKATKVKNGLELKLSFSGRTENFIIPNQDVEVFLDELNLSKLQRFMINLPNWLKLAYNNVKLTAFPNVYVENSVFGVMLVVKESENVYKDRKGNMFYFTAPQGIGLGSGIAEFCSDPDVTDLLTQYYDRITKENL